ncbi:TlpA disulfide reductase family protein [Pseudomonas sp. RIT-PI-AD]|uniref:TlpA disulfide reductase family protein n=1 Tax=Pseudomonas sp. RIT-PI-AD TaxID=3035294 RepID=UPI0021D97227|nr:TlpA disulfide reductase family protein [Pseudomonas sp. RIT-PI-AD]
MGMRLQSVLAAFMAMGTVVLLGGCADDAGVDQHGRKVPAARLEGQWLVINYWAEWCAPCRTEIPELNAFAERQAGQSVEVFGVNFDGLQAQELARASEQLGIRFTVLAQDPASRFGLPRSEALPVTYVIDDKGKLRERLMGEQNAEGLTAKLAELRKE